MKRSRFRHLKISFLAGLLVLLLFSWGGCSFFLQNRPGLEKPFNSPGGKKSELQDDSGTISIVTTIFPLADILKNLAGDRAEITTLLPSGATPHTYEPTVEQMKAVAGADLIVSVGGGLDNWLLSLASAAQKDSVVEIMDLVEGALYDEELLCPAGDNLRYGQVQALEGSCLESRETVGRQVYYYNKHDPHLWLDPVLVKEIIAPLLTKKLVLSKPAQEDYFVGNLKTFQDALDELHDEICDLVQDFSETRFISYHSAWNYFARRYGLEEVAAIEEFPGKEPSGKWLAELVKLADLYNLKVIFAEPQMSTKVAEVIANEIGGQVFFLDPLGGKGSPGKDSYLGLMRSNAETFKEALF